MRSASTSSSAALWLEAIPVAVAILGEAPSRLDRAGDLTVLHANPRARALLGLPAAGAALGTVGRFCEPDALRRFADPHTARGGEIEVRFLPRDGAPLAIRAARCGAGFVAVLTAAESDDPDGRRLAFETGRIGVWQLWPQEGRLHWSREECALMGVAPEAFGGRLSDFLARLPPGVEEERAGAVYADLRDRGEHQGLTPIVRPDGAARWIRERSRVLARDADGAPVHVIGVSQDVTEETEALARAERAESRLRAAIDAAPFGIGVFDAAGRLELCNAPYAWTVPGAANLIAPGMSYGEIMRAVMAAGEYPEHAADPEAWIAEKLARQAAGHDAVEPRAGGRWVRCIDVRTAQGDGVAFRIDVSEERRRVAEARRAAAELTAREREITSFFDLSLDLLGVASPEGRLLRVNRAWSDLLGLPSEELVGRSLCDLMDPGEATATMRAVTTAARGERVLDLVCRCRRVDGTAASVEWRFAPAPDGGVHLAGRDVSERIAAAVRRERRLAQEKALTRAMALALEPSEAAAFARATVAILIEEPVWRLAVKGVALFLDADDARMPVAARGLDPAGADARGPGVLRAAIMDGPHPLGTLILVAAGLEAPHAEDAAFLRRVADVLAVGLVRRRLAAESEAARRRAEDALAELRTYRDALHAHAIISETDPDGVILSVNDNFCAATGYSAGELVGRTHRLVNSGLQPAGFFAALWATIRSGRSWRGDICDRAKTGALAWFDTTIFPVCDGSGAILRYVAIRFDITARVESEAALARANADLDEVAEIAGVGGWARVIGCRELRWDGRTRRIFDAKDGFVPDIAAVSALFSAEDRRRVEDAITHAATEGANFDLEADARTLSGRSIRLRVIGRPVREGGRMARIAGVVQDLTERHLRAQRSERLQRRIEAIFEHTDAVIFLKDRAGRFLFGNPRFLAEVGVADVRGLTDFDLMPREQAEAMTSADQRIFETGEPMRGEEVVVRPDGRRSAFATSKFLIPDPETDEVVLCAVAADITDRKRRETEVERLRERFQTVFDAADSAIFLKRRDGRFVAGNRRFLTYHDLPDAAALEGLTNDDLFPPALARRFTESDAAVFATGRPDRREEEAADAEGRVRYFSTSKVLVPDEESGDWLLCGVATEVTEQREREIENQRLRARFEAVFEGSGVAMSLRTRDGTLVAANRRMHELFGGPGATTAHADEYLDPDTRNSVGTVTARLFASGAPETREEIHVAAQGERRTLLVSRALIADPVMGADLMLTVAADISQQKALQAAAEASRQEAERANAAKTAFLATMSHEIRTPLNGVIGMAALLRRDVFDSNAGSMVEIIHQSGEALLTLLNDILDFSKIDSGHMELEAQPFLADSVARRVAAVHELKAREKGLSLTLRVAEDAAGPWIGDAHRIQQVLHNLVGNAVKFTELGGVTVDVCTARAAPGDAERLRITVEDSGIGMTDEQKARVFDAFAQADGSTTRRFGGTGLGLSIVKGLAEAMGGVVAVRTAPGAGSTFTLDLPLPRAGEVAQAAPRAEDEAADLAGLRVLAADDDHVNRLVLGAMLGALGVRAEIVADGAAAIAASSNGGHDVLLLDISMPGLDGVETLRAIRSAEAARGAPPAPALAVTAHAFASQVEAIMRAGFDSHLAKPLTRAALVARLRALAEGLRASGSGQAPIV